MKATRVALVGRDLLFGSRIAGVVEAAGADLTRVDDPGRLPPARSVQLVLVDWADRQPSWAAQLHAWRGTVSGADEPRIALFGPHTDVAAHADARSVGLGPMLARSAILGWVTRELSS